MTEKDLIDEPNTEQEEDSDSIVVDLSKPDDDAKQLSVDDLAEDEDQEPQKEAKAEEEKPKPSSDVVELEKVRQAIREEIKPKDEKPQQETESKDVRFSEAELQKAEEELDEKLENGEITAAEHRRIQRIIDRHRFQNMLLEREEKIKTESHFDTYEKAIVAWAKENIPELADESSKESKDAVAFLEETLGARKQGNKYILPEKVAKIMAGVISKARNTVEKNQQKAQTDERKKALISKQPPKTGQLTKESLATSKMSRREAEILSSLGLRKDKIDLYRRFKNVGKRNIDVEE